MSAQNVMSEEYCRVWDSLRPTIEDNIEKFRKADGEIVLKNVKPGTEVTIEQVSHEFIFGSNIFLYDHFDSAEMNDKYLAPFGPLFNSATVAFYWKKLEIEKGKPRYAADSPFEYRRPATDTVVDFCESRGIHMKGHALIYGIRSWGHPEWMSEDRKEWTAPSRKAAGNPVQGASSPAKLISPSTRIWPPPQSQLWKNQASGGQWDRKEPHRG